MVLAVMVAVPYDVPINHAADILAKSKRYTLHFMPHNVCTGSPLYICAGGSYEMYFKTVTNIEHSQLYKLATQKPE